jgi:hypothetical protein
MNVYVVPEQERHMILLQHLLEPVLSEDVAFRAGGNWSSADSLARSFLIVKQKPVAIVVGVQENEEGDVRFLKRSLGQVSGDIPFHICLIAPEIESILFTDETVIRGLIGRSLKPKEKALAVTEPYRALVHAIAPDLDPDLPYIYYYPDPLEKVYRERLPHLNLSRVREHPKIVELRQFVEQCLRPAAPILAAA